LSFAVGLGAVGAVFIVVAGPVFLSTPRVFSLIVVYSAAQMQAAVERALPADAAVLVAAVADWTVEAAESKLKKADGPPRLGWAENPDILASLAASARRPRLLVGFAAETDDVVAAAAAKRERKGCDWIVANDVSGAVMGGDRNRVHLITADGVEAWDEESKAEVARRLAERIANALA
jgi:phosphopantothenoylcysteine decarboxylase/phosphopantothenate--cysteine ligase